MTRRRGDKVMVYGQALTSGAANFARKLLKWAGGVDVGTFLASSAFFKHPDNPILSPGTGGSWDDTGVLDPCVIRESATSWKMWYLGYDGAGSPEIGYATSTDGIHWTKHGGNPVFQSGGAGAWDEMLWEARVIQDPWNVGQYLMYYQARAVGSNFYQTGLATSPDGITWTRYANNPVLPYGSPGAWDEGYAGCRDALYVDGTLYLFYEGGKYNTDKTLKLGLATSKNGRDFTKQGADGLVMSGDTGAWDDDDLIPAVKYVRGQFVCMYSQNHRIGVNDYDLGIAISKDGVNWIKDTENPLFEDIEGSGTEWDSQKAELGGTFIQVKRNLYYVYYRGTAVGADWSVGLAIIGPGSGSYPNWAKKIEATSTSPGIEIIQNGTGYTVRFKGPRAVISRNLSTVTLPGLSAYDVLVLLADATNGNIALSLIADNNKKAYLFFGNPDAEARAWMSVDPTNFEYAFALNGVDKLKVDNNAYLKLRVAVAAPGASEANFGILFIDPADGDLKIRFPNGTVATIATD